MQNSQVKTKAHNFCPVCGNALNFDAIRLRDQQIKKAKLEVLDELVVEVTDPKFLETILKKVKSL